MNGDLLQKVLCMHCDTQCLQPCSRPPPTHTSAGDSWTLMGKSGSISCAVTVALCCCVNVTMEGTSTLSLLLLLRSLKDQSSVFSEKAGKGEKKAVYVFWSRQPISQRDLKVRDNYRIRLGSFELT